MKRITKREAKRRFANGEIIYLCPCKMVPDGPFSMAVSIHSKEHLEQADMLYGPESNLWKGSREETAWQIMYNNWKFYNASYETGYYAHYYVP